ncbi:MAG: branched-chain amino acid ABC transporter permease, partial [Oscillospiraceae bacterium]|nr:branched-chain amino acid ABC transporter permease [Oscillospiraceae bacterium]
MQTVKFKDCNILRFAAFIVIPLAVLIVSASKPTSYVTGLIVTVGIYSLLCASLNLVNGFSGMFSMGHAAFMCIGAYVSAFFTVSPTVLAKHCPGLPGFISNTTLWFPIALLLGGIAAAIVSFVIAFPVVRTKGHYLSVATLALIVIVKAVVDNQDKLTNGSRGLTGLPKLSTVWPVYIIMIISMFIMYRLMHSSYGRGLIAMRDDPVAAQTLGVNLVTKKLSIFAFSAFFAGVGGGLFGHYLTAISGQAFYFSKSFDIVEISIIGGMGSLSGSILGAIFYTIVPTFLQPMEGGMKIFGVQLPQLFGLSNIIMAVIIILLIIFRRQGIMGNSEIILDTLFGKQTYISLFKKEEWKKAGRFFADIPVRIKSFA